MYRSDSVRALLCGPRVREGNWAASICHGLVEFSLWFDGRSIASLVMLSAASELLAKMSAVVGLPSGASVDRLMLSCVVALGATFLARGSLVTGVSTRYLVGLLLTATMA